MHAMQDTSWRNRSAQQATRVPHHAASTDTRQRQSVTNHIERPSGTYDLSPTNWDQTRFTNPNPTAAIRRPNDLDQWKPGRAVTRTGTAVVP